MRASADVRASRRLIEQLDGWQSTPLPQMRPMDGAVRAPLPERGGTDSIYLAAPGTEERLEAVAGGSGRLPPSRAGSSAPSPPIPRRITDGSGGGPDGARRYLDEEHTRLDRLDGKTMTTARLPPAPVVGDARVSFSEVPVPDDGVSILAAVGGAPSRLRGGGGGSGGRSGGNAKPVLRPWVSDAAAKDADEAALGGGGSNWLNSAPSLFMLVRGRVGPQAMLQLARQKSDRLKWLLRGIGAFAMWGGFAMTLSFLPALASYVPLIGGLAASLTGVATGLAALGGALAGSGLVIAAAWARFRPFHAAGLGLAAAACAAGQAWFLRQRALGHSLGGAPPIKARRPTA